MEFQINICSHACWQTGKGWEFLHPNKDTSPAVVMSKPPKIHFLHICCWVGPQEKPRRNKGEINLDCCRIPANLGDSKASPNQTLTAHPKFLTLTPCEPQALLGSAARKCFFQADSWTCTLKRNPSPCLVLCSSSHALFPNKSIKIFLQIQGLQKQFQEGTISS